MKTKPITVVLWTVVLPLLTLGSSLNASAKAEMPEPTFVQAPQAEDANVGMVVTALITLSADGEIEAVELQRADAPRFAESVEAAVKQWRFKPAIRNGKAVPSKVLVPFKVVPQSAKLVAMR